MKCWSNTLFKICSIIVLLFLSDVSNLNICCLLLTFKRLISRVLMLVIKWSPYVHNFSYILFRTNFALKDKVLQNNPNEEEKSKSDTRFENGA